MLKYLSLYLFLIPSIIYAQSTKVHPPLQGFEMTNLRIPYTEIKQGGPPKDGIPAIDYPKFIAVNEAKDFLHKNDFVIGIEKDGVAKAYPIRILNYHEVVNDWIAKEPIVVTYCPLCRSGVVFSAKVNNRRRSFGVSGLLYNSDVLLYDRETSSLWSQILSEAVSGPASSAKLQILPSSFMTFKAWAKQYPESLVLSTETGAVRDYDISPYQGYESAEKLLFPVSHESTQLRRKDKVIGIEINGQSKAYPFRRLKKLKEPLEDSLGGEKIFVHYDKYSRSAHIKNEQGEILSGISLYWFAWFTFHPNTQVYSN